MAFSTSFVTTNLGAVLIFYLKVPIFCTYAILRVYGMYHPSMLRFFCQGTVRNKRFFESSWCLGKSRRHRLPRAYRVPTLPAVSLVHTCYSWRVEQTSPFRLAFVTLKNNLMVLSLRAMISQFVLLMLIAVFCFTGFLYALWT